MYVPHAPPHAWPPQGPLGVAELEGGHTCTSAKSGRPSRDLSPAWPSAHCTKRVPPITVSICWWLWPKQCTALRWSCEICSIMGVQHRIGSSLLSTPGQSFVEGTKWLKLITWRVVRSGLYSRHLVGPFDRGCAICTKVGAHPARVPHTHLAPSSVHRQRGGVELKEKVLNRVETCG